MNLQVEHWLTLGVHRTVEAAVLRWRPRSADALRVERGEQAGLLLGRAGGDAQAPGLAERGSGADEHAGVAEPSDEGILRRAACRLVELVARAAAPRRSWSADRRP